MRWFTTLIARLTTYFLYRRFEVDGEEHIPRDRPVLIVANHVNGLLDPAVLVAALNRTPRFLAKATLSRIVGVGWLLRACGVIFVHRQQDGRGTGGNVEAFAASHDALRDGDTVAIFPEGTTHDRPSVEPVRTGAARIALGAIDAGADRLVVLPIGMTFTDKVSLRGDALVVVGPPIDPTTIVDTSGGAQDTEAVRTLTAAVDHALRQVSPDFPDVESWLALGQAAEVTARKADRPRPPLAVQARIARQLSKAAPDRQAEVQRQVGRYATVLARLRIDDRDVVTPMNLRRLVRSAIGTGLLVVILGSLVGATITVNIIPLGVVMLASLRMTAPVMKGTVRALVGLVAFPTTWFTAATLSVDGAWSVLGLAGLFALGAVAAIALADRTVRFVGSLLRWRLAHERQATLVDAVAIRADVVRAVEEALKPA
ncbi:1-acyl-sn-glycerol-3-phosphate acyltransferase [Euzebya tangerina]|uniref:1-acyl-sn-glycerol-3-phosphate acyltransferase n=1 Tax=Euzebya tangerina TaxID=591198 RepID=UPI0013C3107D|nr:1-acyl-sn-glycerol-3-phosphate acyltransferase [Euzebya tangerina]